jgi:hypothetical protein
MCIYCIKYVDFNKLKIIKDWNDEKKNNYNDMLSGWIIINIIKLIAKSIFLHINSIN